MGGKKVEMYNVLPNKHGKSYMTIPSLWKNCFFSLFIPKILDVSC